MQVEFEVLFQSGAGRNTSTLDSLALERPSANDLIRCGRWLAAHGVETHPTEFSIVCSCEPALFEQLFATHLVEIREKGNDPPFFCETPPVVPDALRDCVDRIEISGRPIYLP